MLIILLPAQTHTCKHTCTSTHACTHKHTQREGGGREGGREREREGGREGERPFQVALVSTIEDRFRTAGGTAVQGAGELTDNEVVGGVTEVAGNQIKADEDTSAGERVAMLLGDSMATIGDSDMIEGPGGDVLGKVGEGISEHGGDVIEKLKGKESDEDDD